MWRLMNRVVLAVGFLAVVWLVVAEPKVQGQSKSSGGTLQLALPFMFRHATGTPDPALRDYMGLLYGYENDEGVYYTVRGDGSEWRQLTETGVNDSTPGSSSAWSPDGKFLVYILDGHTHIIRVSDAEIVEAFPFRASETIWSRDSQSLYLAEDRETIYIYDVESRILYEAEYESGIESPILRSVGWSSDSNYIAWYLYDPSLPGYTLWLWQRDTTSPVLQAEGLYADALTWTPDATRFAMTGYDSENPQLRQIYTGVPGQPGVETILEGYSFLAWVEGGTRLAVWREGKVYLASPDGQAIEPWSDPSHDLTYSFYTIAISDKAMLYTAKDSQYLQTIGESTPLNLGPRYCNDVQGCYEYFRWNPDGTLFIRRYGISNRGGESSTIQVGDTTLTPPRYINTIEDYRTPVVDQFEPFLPHSANYFALSRSEGGYPAPSYIYSYIYNGRTSSLWYVPYERNGQMMVLEWRYMP